MRLSGRVGRSLRSAPAGLPIVIGLTVAAAWLFVSGTPVGPTAQAPGLQVAAAERILLVFAAARAAPYFNETLAENARQVAGVAKIQRMLVVNTRPHDVIGVEPGAPLRILAEGPRVVVVTVTEGRTFKVEEADKRVAIVGRGTAVEDYRPGGDAMSGMRHGFNVGSSFALRGATARLRVIGIYAGAPEDKVFLPLATAQKLLKQEGRLSHLFVAVTSGSSLNQVASALRAALGTGVEVVPVR